MPNPYEAPVEIDSRTARFGMRKYRPWVAVSLIVIVLCAAESGCCFYRAHCIERDNPTLENHGPGEVYAVALNHWLHRTLGTILAVVAGIVAVVAASCGLNLPQRLCDDETLESPAVDS
jgi:hypothetical protein